MKHDYINLKGNKFAILETIIRDICQAEKNSAV